MINMKIELYFVEHEKQPDLNPRSFQGTWGKSRVYRIDLREQRLYLEKEH